MPPGWQYCISLLHCIYIISFFFFSFLHLYLFYNVVYYVPFLYSRWHRAITVARRSFFKAWQAKREEEMFF